LRVKALGTNMMIETKRPMHLKDYLKVVEHVEAQIKKFFIRAAAGDGRFFTGCGGLGTEITTDSNESIWKVFPS
jgi:hypothetical protein